jgi:hypothetical protein
MTVRQLEDLLIDTPNTNPTPTSVSQAPVLLAEHLEANLSRDNNSPVTHQQRVNQGASSLAPEAVVAFNQRPLQRISTDSLSSAATTTERGGQGADAVPTPQDAEPAAVDNLPSDSSDQDVPGQQDLAVSADLLCAAGSKTKQQQPLLFAPRQASSALMDNLNSISTRPTAEGAVSLSFSSGQMLMNKGISGGLCAFETQSSLYAFAPRFDEQEFGLISTELDLNRKQTTHRQARRAVNNGNG